MGNSFDFTCPSCGKKFHYSYGFNFFLDENTLRRSAGYSETKKFVEEHPNGLVDCRNVVKRCKKMRCIEEQQRFQHVSP